MHFYWIRDRLRQGQEFLVYWKKGILNKADYFTKHHSASHHQAIRSSYLHLPRDWSKNYFESVEDSDAAPALPTTNAVTFSETAAKPACCEGVLIVGFPREPGDPFQQPMLTTH